MTTQKSSEEEQNTSPVKRKRGRPSKAELAKHGAGSKPGKPGRPKGDAAIINDYKRRMLASPKSAAVLQTIWDAALNDEHKHQAAAWKIVADRILPAAAFDRDVKKAGGGNKIEISISGVPGVQINGTENDEVEDAEWVPVDRPEGDEDADN